MNGTLVSTGDSILVSQHNPPFQDVAQGITNSLDRTGSGGMLSDLAMGNNRITGLADGVADTDAATVGQLGGSAGGLPIGAVIDFAGDTAPTGYFLCYGQAVSRATYSELFTAIGTAFGTGDGSTTFNLPDFRGRTAFGKDNMGGSAASRVTSGSGITGTTLGAAGGAQTVTLTTSEMPAHSHTVTDPGHSHSYLRNTGDSGFVGVDPVPTLSSAGVTGSATTGITIASAGGGAAHNNMPPAIILNKIIRAL